MKQRKNVFDNTMLKRHAKIKRVIYTYTGANVLDTLRSMFHFLMVKNSLAVSSENHISTESHAMSENQ